MASRTGEGKLWEDEEVEVIKVFRVYPAQDRIGAVEVVIDITYLRRELQAGDPHGVRLVPLRAAIQQLPARSNL